MTAKRREVGRIRPAWLTAVALYFGLLFVVLPIVVAFGTAAVWTYYVCGFVTGLGIGLLTARWYRTTLIEIGPYHRVIRVDALRAAKRADKSPRQQAR